MNIKKEMNIEKITADTPCQNVYFDHAGASVPPMPVIETVDTYLQSAVKYGTKVHWAKKRDNEYILKAKSSIARLIGAKSNEIAFTTNGSDAICTIINGINFKKGDNVVLDELRFICNAVPWLRLKQNIGIKIKIAKANKPGFIDLKDLENKIDEKTKIVALTHMPPNLGTIQPAKQVARIAHEKGALFFLDACNTVGVVSIDVEDVGCDFMAVSGRKYLRGITGTGFIYVKEKHICDLQPSFVGWKSGKWNWSEDSYEDLETIDRFMSGEPNLLGVYSLWKAAEYIFDIGGISNIECRVSSLTEYLIEKLNDVPNIEIYGPITSKGRAGLITFNIKGIPSLSISKYLHKYGIVTQASHYHCPGPLRMFNIDSVVRICLHYWNTLEDIDRVVFLLNEIDKKGLNN